MKLRQSNFETQVRGQKTRLFVLENSNGISCAITNYGGRVVGCDAPDSNGRLEDVVLGFDDIDAYLHDTNSYFGAVVGRVANRTSGAAFDLKGEKFVLDMNHGKHHIHGGFEGLHKQVWQADIAAKRTLLLNYISKEGEGGYPGEVRIEVTYTLTDENELAISYRAWTNRLTPLNLTNHTYFNMGGEGSGSILEHECQIFAEAYHPIDKDLIPSGFAASVAGTPFDFRMPTGIGSRIDTRDTQLERAGGYDHNYILDDRGSAAPAAMVCDMVSGRCLELFTDRPGLQFYSGNFLDGSQVGKSQHPYARRTGFCLEAQGFPNSINQSGFPSILISPDAPYSAFCAYRLAKI